MIEGFQTHGFENSEDLTNCLPSREFPTKESKIKLEFTLQKLERRHSPTPTIHLQKNRKECSRKG
jgi:hypothetical protein